jgi:Protein of unknown function/Domain of unknown function (DUF1835)
MQMKADSWVANLQDIEPKKILNVVFSPFVYDAISQLLDKESRDENIAIISGGFHLGPIGRDDFHAREKWFRDHVDPDFSETPAAALCESYVAITLAQKDNGHVFVWVDLTSSAEYADFLYWIDRCKLSNFFIVEPNPHSENGGVPSLSLARVNARLIRSDELVEYALLWNKLKAEDAAFRLFFQTGEFRSFAIDAFDQVLVNSVAEDWQSISTILVKAMDACWTLGISIPGDLVFHRRLIWLSQNSTIELRGDGKDFSRSDLRIRC